MKHGCGVYTMKISDEIISKSTATISVLTSTNAQDTISLIISITSAIISLSYTLYKWYQRIKNSNNKLKEVEKILDEIEKEININE